MTTTGTRSQPITATIRRGREASDRLTRALLELAASGLRTHCSDVEKHSDWISESDGERALAALWCRGCPALPPCLDAAQANRERWGVWGGRDFSQRPGKRTQREAA
jgi:hypothetical protein